MKSYIANFYLSKEYQHFDTYWRRFVYVQVVDKMGELYPELDTTKLRVKFLNKVHQILAEDTVEVDEEVDQGDALEDETSDQEALSTESPAIEMLDL